MNKYVVYTVITNGYDNLIEPAFAQDGIDYICFTDSKDLKGDIWQIREIPEWTKNIPQNKRQRMLKVLPHLLFPEYEMSLYIDGNVKIRGDVKNIFEILEEHIISIPKHPQRNCLYREAIAVMKMSKDVPENVMPQVERYLAENFPTDNGLFETNIVFRKHDTPECKRLMDRWALEIMMGSHRDQLSLTYAMWTTETDVFALPMNARKSDVFWTNMLHGAKAQPNQESEVKVEEYHTVKQKKKLKSKPKTMDRHKRKMRKHR